MPAITRWFKVTHDINADPELWELRELYGDRAALVWLEMLSIADRNRGVVGPESDQTRNQLASKCRSSRVKVGLILDWCRVKGWLVSDQGLRVAKWSKYNKTRDDDKNRHGKRSTALRDPPSPDISITTLEEKIKRARSYPENFQASEEVKAWAKIKRLPDPETHLEAFRDYHTSKGSTFKDWDAAFRTWIRNAARFKDNGKPVEGRPIPPIVKPRTLAPEPSKEERQKLSGLLKELSAKLSIK